MLMQEFSTAGQTNLSAWKRERRPVQHHAGVDDVILTLGPILIVRLIVLGCLTGGRRCEKTRKRVECPASRFAVQCAGVVACGPKRAGAYTVVEKCNEFPIMTQLRG